MPNAESIAEFPAELRSPIAQLVDVLLEELKTGTDITTCVYRNRFHPRAASSPFPGVRFKFFIQVSTPAIERANARFAIRSSVIRSVR